MKKELTPEVTTDDEELNEVIRKCLWRKNVQGTSFCGGMLGVCARVIENGECDALRQYFDELYSDGDWIPMEEDDESVRGEDKQ